jgi:hypothetical protein
MAATKQDVDNWIKRAKSEGYKYIISVCDTWDYDDYPVFCKDELEMEKEKIKHNNVNMQRINEIIKIDNDIDLGLPKKNSEPFTHKIVFVVSQFDESNIIRGNDLNDLINDYIGSSYLKDILDTESLKDVPKEIGAYSADLKILTTTCNHHEDPTEYDMSIWLENIKKIELKYD